MNKFWITLPAENVRIQMPMSLFEGDIKIVFNDVETIDDTIKQLNELKKNY